MSRFRRMAVTFGWLALSGFFSALGNQFVGIHMDVWSLSYGAFSFCWLTAGALIYAKVINPR